MNGRRRVVSRRRADPSVALINVVFLMLIFFLFAGQVAPPLDTELKLVRTADLEGRSPPDALILLADGSLRYRGAVTEPQAHLEEIGQGPVRIVPDRAVTAARLVEVTLALRAAGATRVLVVAERGLQ